MEGNRMEEEVVKDMTPRLVGETYLRKATEASPQRYRYGIFKCPYCEKEFEASSGNIQSGHTKSCGCQKGGITHGLSHNQFYKTWKNMMGRCYNLKNKHYQSYGGRGITVCEEWLDVTNFVAWCDATHPNIEGVSLDRIDNDGGYSPENCRWADTYTQVINQRMCRTNTSGYVGITWSEAKLKWVSRISVEKKRVSIGSFKIKEEAVQARDNYIIENKLPHKLSTDYNKETNEQL